MADAVLTPPPVAARIENSGLTPAARPVGYFERRGPVNLILGTFFVVTLPLAAVTLWVPNPWLTWAYIWLFGMTHFVVTFAVYLQSGNLKHFAASPRNIAVFLAVPAVILIGFDLVHVFGLRAEFPVAALVLWAAIRAFDFHHFNRQSFGVLQLFKGRTGVKYPTGLKRLENWYFGALSGLLLTTALAGGASPLLPGVPQLFPPVLPLAILAPLSVAFLIAATALGVGVAVGHRRIAAANPAAGGCGHAAAYMLFQTAGALAAAAWLPLYIAALALHYVEYHVLMYPRCFAAKLDPAARMDRVFAKLRASRLRFYAAVVVLAFAVTAAAAAGMGAMGRDPAPADTGLLFLVLVASFDGLFVFHYFVEMFIWKFSDPHFRKSLAGLYFAPKPAAR